MVTAHREVPSCPIPSWARCVHSLVDVGLDHLDQLVDVVEDSLWCAQQEILAARARYTTRATAI